MIGRAPRAAAGRALAARPHPSFKMLVPCALVLAALACWAPGASASIGWCKTDPGVLVGDEVVAVIVSAPPGIVNVATGPTAVVVHVPRGTTTAVLWTDPGFGYGETVTILESDRLRARKGAIPIVVEVTVPATGPMPVLVEVAPASAGVVTAAASGTTNGTVRLATVI